MAKTRGLVIRATLGAAVDAMEASRDRLPLEEPGPARTKGHLAGHAPRVTPVGTAARVARRRGVRRAK